MTVVEIRSAGPGDIDATDEGVIFGLAIPYNRETTIGDMEHGGFREKIAPGACTKSLREGDIVALLNHNSGQPLGRTTAGNLTLKNTTRGVEPELQPVDTSYARDLAELVKSKTIRGWSFGFEVVKDDWTDGEGKESDCWRGSNRTIREMRLIEVSPVTFPAYDMTTISARDAISAAREGRDEKRGGNAPGDGSKPYGNVTYADPGYNGGKKRYPIDTKAHAKAAWSYISKAKNAGAYTAAQLASIKSKIKAACKKFGIDVSEQNEAEYAKEWRIYLKGYDPEAGTAERDDEDSAAEAERKKMSAGTKKRIPQIVVELGQALELFRGAGITSLPEDVQQAVALVSSAATHAGHMQEHEKLDVSDAASAKDDKTRADNDPAGEQRDDEEKPKPDDSTSTAALDDNALILATLQVMSRDAIRDQELLSSNESGV